MSAGKKERESSSAAGVSSSGEDSREEVGGGPLTTQRVMIETGDPPERVTGNFRADLWREQVCDADDLIASSKLILFVLGVRMDEEGKCLLTYEELSSTTTLSTVSIGRATTILEEKGWYKRSRKQYGYEYIALKGREGS